MGVKAEIANVKALIEEGREALRLSEGTVARQNFIVVCDGVAISPQVRRGVNGAEVLTGQCGTGAPWAVPRFTKEDAKTIAKNVTNGAGTPGVIRQWKQETLKRIADYEFLLEKLEAVEKIEQL
jgi:hypothetical protein